MHMTNEQKRALALETTKAVAAAVKPIQARYNAAVHADQECPLCVARSLAVGVSTVLVTLLGILDTRAADEFVTTLRNAVGVKRDGFERTIRESASSKAH
jgi:hypothetical protein